MKRSNLLQLVTVSLLLAFTVVGCKKTPKGVTTIPGRPNDVPSSTGLNPPISRNGGGQDTLRPIPNGETPAIVTPRPIVDPNNPNPLPPNDRDLIDGMMPDATIFASETVYFEYDKSSIRTSERSKLEAVASYLKTKPDHKVQIAGNCDERGTEEYNRSLGERRALSAREYLITLGISGDRIFTISYGEDKPADPGHDDSAFAKNRRDEFIALKPK